MITLQIDIPLNHARFISIPVSSICGLILFFISVQYFLSLHCSHVASVIMSAITPLDISLKFDFTVGDRVFMVTDEDDQIPGIVTQVIFTGVEAMYMVARGMDEKICCSNELRDIKELP